MDATNAERLELLRWIAAEVARLQFDYGKCTERGGRYFQKALDAGAFSGPPFVGLRVRIEEWVTQHRQPNGDLSPDGYDTVWFEAITWFTGKPSDSGWNSEEIWLRERELIVNQLNGEIEATNSTVIQSTHTKNHTETKSPKKTRPLTLHARNAAQIHLRLRKKNPRQKLTDSVKEYASKQGEKDVVVSVRGTLESLYANPETWKAPAETTH